MKLFVAALATLAIAACSQTPTAAGSPRTSPPSSPTVQPSLSPVTDLPLSKVGFTCRLPVTEYVIPGGDYASYKGSSISFPQATLQADPAGLIANEDLAGGFATSAKPVLHGTLQTGAPFYDLAKKRWVPVGAGQSSPDGSSYAYGVMNASGAAASFAIHVVTVSSGADRIFTVPTTPDVGGAGAWVGDFDGSSVYFSSQQQMGPPAGVWRLDIASGAVRQLSKVLSVAAIGGGYIWLNRIDPRDPEGPQTGRSGLRANSVVRVDLSTGQETVWYYAKGHQVFLDGVDRLGAPIVSDAPPPNFTHVALRLVSRPESTGITIYDGVGGLNFSAPQSDISGRLWLGGDRGVYLWTPAVGLQKVFASNGDPMFPKLTLPAGLCT